MADRVLATVASLVDQLGPAIEQNDRAKILDIIAQLVAQRAPMGRQWEQLSYIAAGHGELTLARAALDLLVEASGGGHLAQYQKAGILALLGDWRAADALLQTLPDTVPDPVSNSFSRGIAAINLGRPEEARRYLEHVTEKYPQAGMAWHSLSMTVDFSKEPALAGRLAASAPAVKFAALSERVPFHYALGKMHADRGEYAQAFEAYARGASLQKSTASFDRKADQAEAETATDGYSAERIAAIASQQREPTDRTIFVTGLPRSGTTLVEQILTSHSTVSDGGEIARLMLLENEVGGASYAALSDYVETKGVQSAARLWHHWLDELFPGSQRILDKTINSSRYLGLAAALLPDAPLIWMTRDPLDRAWSCFRTNFAEAAMSWSYDLEDIAAHFRVEDEALTRWQQILGDRLLVLSYEALIAEPETWIRRILKHCGLAEEQQVFAPHENKRPVPTASMVQVRRPINRDGIGSAEPYRTFLKPFLDAYYG